MKKIIKFKGDDYLNININYLFNLKELLRRKSIKY